MKTFFKDNKNNILILFIFFYIYYYPIISSDLIFQDDNVRTFWMRLSWAREGRNLAEFFTNILVFSNGVPVFPLTHILSVFCISVTIIYATKTIFNEISFFSTSLVSLIFLNPFYLQNMSYGYDNLTMTMSTCFAILSALLLLKNKKYIYLTALFIFCILFTYQTSIGIYVSFIILILFKKFLEGSLNNKDHLFYKLTISLLILALLLVTFKITFPILFPGEAVRSITSIHNIIPNLLVTINFVKLLFYPHALIVLIVTLISIFISTIFLAIHNKKNIFIYLLITGIVFLLLVLNSSGPSILLQHQNNDPRIFISISCIWFLVFYLISSCSKKLYYIIYIFFTLFCFSVNYIYGYFLQQQQQYYNIIVNQISYDINHHPSLQNNQFIIAINPLPLSPINQRLIERVPVLEGIYDNQLAIVVTPKLSHTFINSYMGGYDDILRLTKELQSSKNKAVISTKSYNLFSYKNNTFIYFNQ